MMELNINYKNTGYIFIFILFILFVYTLYNYFNNSEYMGSIANASTDTSVDQSYLFNNQSNDITLNGKLTLGKTQIDSNGNIAVGNGSINVGGTIIDSTTGNITLGQKSRINIGNGTIIDSMGNITLGPRSRVNIGNGTFFDSITGNITLGPNSRVSIGNGNTLLTPTGIFTRSIINGVSPNANIPLSGVTSGATSGVTSGATSGVTSGVTSGATSGVTSGATSGVTSGAASVATNISLSNAPINSTTTVPTTCNPILAESMNSDWCANLSGLPFGVYPGGSGPGHVNLSGDGITNPWMCTNPGGSWQTISCPPGYTRGFMNNCYPSTCTGEQFPQPTIWKPSQPKPQPSGSKTNPVIT